MFSSNVIQRPDNPFPTVPAVRYSVVIPTIGRPVALGKCLHALSLQRTGDGAFEVIVVLDGPDPASRAVVHEAAQTHPRLNARLIESERLGNAHTKNLGLRAARGELAVFLNDDVEPAPGFLAAHGRVHESRDGHAAMVLGWSPWVEHRPESLLDRLVRTTSMIFFYDRMIDVGGTPTRSRGHDWGFRHCWTLNLSVRRALALEAGGFLAPLANCCYEDVEFGHRFTHRFDAPVLFEPDAVAPHDHRYTPGAYLQREFRLGYSAFGLAHHAPACGREIFGADLKSPESLEYARRFVDHEARNEPASRAAFERLGQMPGTAIDGPHADDLRQSLFTQHVLLKRLSFRRGLLAAAAGERAEGLHPHDMFAAAVL